MPDLHPLAEVFANVIRAWMRGLTLWAKCYEGHPSPQCPVDLSNFQNIYVFSVMDCILSLQNSYVETQSTMRQYLEMAFKEVVKVK